MLTQAFVASSYTNRGGCTRRTCLERCAHRHKTYEAASRCVRKRQKREKKARSWRAEKIVWR